MQEKLIHRSTSPMFVFAEKWNLKFWKKTKKKQKQPHIYASEKNISK